MQCEPKPIRIAVALTAIRSLVTGHTHKHLASIFVRWNVGVPPPCLPIIAFRFRYISNPAGPTIFLTERTGRGHEKNKRKRRRAGRIAVVVIK